MAWVGLGEAAALGWPRALPELSWAAGSAAGSLWDGRGWEWQEARLWQDQVRAGLVSLKYNVGGQWGWHINPHSGHLVFLPGCLSAIRSGEYLCPAEVWVGPTPVGLYLCPFVFFFKINFYWSIVDLQCCATLCRLSLCLDLCLLLAPLVEEAWGLCGSLHLGGPPVKCQTEAFSRFLCGV